jgi:hypothetical protein
MALNCSVQGSLRTRTSPPYFATSRSKLVHGTKSMICETSVRPTFTAVLPVGQNRDKYREISNRVQIGTKPNLR